MVTPQLIEEIHESSLLKVLQSNKESPVALSTIAKALKEIFRYFEPSFFDGKLYVFKHFHDEFVFDEANGVLLIDKNPLLKKFHGNLFIQVFHDGKAFLWEDQDEGVLDSQDDLLTYHFEANREYFLIGNETIDFTQYPYGSMFAPQFYFLHQALRDFGVEKIRHSSCPLFREAWQKKPKVGSKEYYDNHVLFQGGGRGSGLPEGHMQASLEYFLKSDPNFRSIDLEVNKEFNVDSEKPKPVDFRINWLEANRIALIEMKWTGASISETEGLTSHGDKKVNDGLEQLKGYGEGAIKDYPKKLIKSFLVVIDGRRNNVTKDSVEVSFSDGMHFENIEFEIEDNRKYFEEIVGFEVPVRLFAEPKCKIA